MKVYLGSKSAARRKILKDNGFEVVSIVADIEEGPSESDKDEFHAMDLAGQVEYITKLKTNAILKKLNGISRETNYLICGDILVQDAHGNCLGKPASSAEACEWLNRYSQDRKLSTVQALEVTDLVTGERVSGTDEVHIYLNGALSEGVERSKYLEDGGAMGASGALILEDPFIQSRLLRIDGDQDSVMGLSMRLLRQLLAKITKNESDYPSK